MKHRTSCLLFAALGLSLAPASAATTLIDTSPPNNQATLAALAGQTFTTPAMGAENQLTTITIVTPATIFDADPTGPYTLKVWANDGDFNTWAPAALVATSTNSASLVPAGNQPVAFQFSGEILADDTVYLFSFSNESEDHVSFRAGLTNEVGLRLEDGALFAGGAQPFGGVFDVSFQLDVIPEPSTALLGGIGLLGLLRRRR